MEDQKILRFSAALNPPQVHDRFHQHVPANRCFAVQRDTPAIGRQQAMVRCRLAALTRPWMFLKADCQFEGKLTFAPPLLGRAPARCSQCRADAKGDRDPRLPFSDH
jgi:hypothetical protein